MPVKNRTPGLVCDITRRKTKCQCPAQIVPPVSCVISQDAEPTARNKSYPCLVCDITRHTTQCRYQIVSSVSRVISQDTEPNAPHVAIPVHHMLNTPAHLAINVNVHHIPYTCPQTWRQRFIIYLKHAPSFGHSVSSYI